MFGRGRRAGDGKTQVGWRQGERLGRSQRDESTLCWSGFVASVESGWWKLVVLRPRSGIGSCRQGQGRAGGWDRAALGWGGRTRS